MEEHLVLHLQHKCKAEKLHVPCRRVPEHIAQNVKLGELNRVDDAGTHPEHHTQFSDQWRQKGRNLAEPMFPNKVTACRRQQQGTDLAHSALRRVSVHGDGGRLAQHDRWRDLDEVVLKCKV